MSDHLRTLIAEFIACDPVSVGLRQDGGYFIECQGAEPTLSLISRMRQAVVEADEHDRRTIVYRNPAMHAAAYGVPAGYGTFHRPARDATPSREPVGFYAIVPVTS